MQVLSMFGGYQGLLTWKIYLQRQKLLGIQDIIWLIQYSQMQHTQLVGSMRCTLIFTWVHLSTPHNTRQVTESGIWYYIFYLNKLLMIINFLGFDRDERK